MWQQSGPGEADAVEFELACPDKWPAIPGHEVSATVAALGEGATTFAAGRHVSGLVAFDRNGGLADFVTVPVTDFSPRNVTKPSLWRPKHRVRNGLRGSPGDR